MDWRPFIGPQTHGLGPQDFFQKNNSFLIEIPVTFAHRTLIFSNINPQSKSFTDFTPRALVFKFYLQISPKPFNLTHKPLLLLKIANLIHQSPKNLTNKPPKTSKFQFSPSELLSSISFQL
jgi:hypothetical protein